MSIQSPHHSLIDMPSSHQFLNPCFTDFVDTSIHISPLSISVTNMIPTNDSPALDLYSLKAVVSMRSWVVQMIELSSVANHSYKNLATSSSGLQIPPY